MPNTANCFISSGQSLGCSDSIGGIKKIYIGGGTGYTSGYTYNATGSVTGATSTSGTTYYGFELKRGTSGLVQTTTKSFENSTVFYEQVLTIQLYKYDQDKRNQMKILGQNDNLQIIAIDQNDVQYLLGQVNFSYMSGGNASSGVALGDKNGYEFIFTAQEAEPARTIIGALATVYSGATISN